MLADVPPNKNYGGLGALDFVMNVWCAASLSGMAGPRTNLDVADGALEELGEILMPEPDGAAS